MAPHKSEDFKLSAVKHYLKIKNQTETCRIFGCSERSLMRWINKFKTTKTVKRKTRKYVAYKVKKEYVEFIKKEIRKNKTITICDLTSKLNQKYNEHLSKSQIANVIKDNNITLKQTKVRHEPKHDTKNQ
jgi:transposase-like protein